MAETNETGDGRGEGGEAVPEETGEGAQLSALEEQLAVYPLREPAEDPRWAVRVVQGWLGFALFSVLFTAALIVLGWFYD